MKVILPVVGIRNYYTEEEKHLPTEAERLASFFSRVPVGSTVYLKIDYCPPYAGQVLVYDDYIDGRVLGPISGVETYLIRPAVTARGLRATVTSHSAADKCFYVEVENTVGIGKMNINKIRALKDEFKIEYTQHDEKLMTAREAARQLFDEVTAKEQPTEDERAELLRAIRNYSTLCCTTLDGETRYHRHLLLFDMNKVLPRFPELKPFYDDIFERGKDLGSRRNEDNVAIYKSQYERVRTAAYSVTPGRMHSPLEVYRRALEYKHVGNISRKVLDEERKSVAEKLSHALKGEFASVKDDDARFASSLYTMKYDLRSMNVLFSRMILHEYLTTLIEKKPTDESTEQSYNPDGIYKRIVDPTHARALMKTLHVMLDGKDVSIVAKIIRIAVDNVLLHKPTLKQVQAEFGLVCKKQQYSDLYKTNYPSNELKGLLNIIKSKMNEFDGADMD